MPIDDPLYEYRSCIYMHCAWKERNVNLLGKWPTYPNIVTATMLSTLN